MLDEFEEVYASDEDAERKLVVAVLGKLLGSASNSCERKEAPLLHTSRIL